MRRENEPRRHAKRQSPQVLPRGNPPLRARRHPPFRFYDNRQKYLAFVNTCNEKPAIARRVAHELSHIHPQPPSLRIFDAGMGDGTVLSRIMRSVHRDFPTVPLLAVAKEISLEDVRLGLDKMPDRFHEHPATVLVITNLNYSEAPRLMPRDMASAAALNWQEVRLRGHSAFEYGEQIEVLCQSLDQAWQTKPSPKTGNPVYARPSVLVIYREDHKFLLGLRHSETRACVRDLRPHRRFSALARTQFRGVQGVTSARAAHAQPCSRRASSWHPVRRQGSRRWKSSRNSGRARIRFRSIDTLCSPH